MRRVHARKVRVLHDSADHHQRLAEVGPCVARRMHQRHERSLVPRSRLPHVHWTDEHSSGRRLFILPAQFPLNPRKFASGHSPDGGAAPHERESAMRNTPPTRPPRRTIAKSSPECGAPCPGFVPRLSDLLDSHRMSHASILRSRPETRVTHHPGYRRLPGRADFTIPAATVSRNARKLGKGRARSSEEGQWPNQFPRGVTPSLRTSW